LVYFGILVGAPQTLPETNTELRDMNIRAGSFVCLSFIGVPAATLLKFTLAYCTQGQPPAPHDIFATPRGLFGERDVHFHRILN
jgi:hypothetical protein